MSFHSILVSAVLVFSANIAFASSLATDQHVTNSLGAAAIADKIQKECPNISMRRLTMLSKALALKSYAKDLGYTNAEIDAFLDSKAERKRIYGLRDQYLAQKGAVASDPQSYCKIGREEIARKTLAGSILRVN